MSQFCVNATLPCDVTRRHCVTPMHLDRMWRVVDQHGRRDVTDAEISRASLLLVYPLLVDIVVRLADMAAADRGTPSDSQEVPKGSRDPSRRSQVSPARMVVYSGHDKTLTALLSALRLHDGRWPVLGARVVIELAAAITGSGRGRPRYYFRLLYDGRDMTSSLDFCRMSGSEALRGVCALDNFIYSVFYHINKRFGSTSHAHACAVR